MKENYELHCMAGADAPDSVNWSHIVAHRWKVRSADVSAEVGHTRHHHLPDCKRKTHEVVIGPLLVDHYQK